MTPTTTPAVRVTPRHPRLVGLLASLALAGLLAGLPGVLLALGWGALPATGQGWWQWLTSPDDGRLALFVFKVAGWLTWVGLAVSILTEITAAARGRSAPTLPGLRWTQRPARRLVAAATLLFVALPTAAGTLTAAAPAAAAAPPETTPHPAATAPVTAVAPVKAATRVKATPAPLHVVVHGDSLWSIAERHLGAGHRFAEIVALNQSLLGDRPGFLKPGWVLTLPADAHTNTDAGPVVAYTVVPGDTLSGIARTQLGDEASWPAIYRASHDVEQSDGHTLTDPDLILPGWTLNLPTDQTAPELATAPAPTTPAPTTPAGTQPRDRIPDLDDAAIPTAIPAPTAPATVAVTPAVSPAQTVPAAAPTTPVVETAGEVAPAPAADEPAATVPAPWLLLGLSGAGVGLAGSLALVLRRRRRSQFRARRPGRAIRPVPADLVPVEKTLIWHEPAAAATVTELHQALLRFAATVAGSGRPLPVLRAVQLGAGRITLLLGDAVDLPAPWVPADTPADPLRWSLPVTEATPVASPCRSPYPQLVSIGRDDTDGSRWLVNLEAWGTISLTGDPTFAEDFARYLAAEIALNPWSTEVRLDCVGVAAEAADLDPARVRHHRLTDEQAISQAITDAVATVQRCADHQVAAATGRATDLGGDLWPSWLLLINGTITSDPLRRLLAVIDDHPQHTATAVVMVGDGEPLRGVGIRLSGQGQVQIPSLGLTLEAVGLTPDEAHGCALLLAAADDLDDTAMPNDGDTGWREHCDAAGAPRPDLVLPRDTDPATLTEDAASVLPGLDDAILNAAAAVAEDLQQLAPLVPASTRQRVHNADDTLDADVAAWLAGDPQRPRLTLLGPIRARTGLAGVPAVVAKRKPFYTEILAFLALHPEGVTTEQLVDAFGYSDQDMRKHLSIVRTWLGKDPATGRLHLPIANQSPAAKERGLGLYQLGGILVDIDLFRRLRLRGTVRGPDGLDDLKQALQLVTGVPFTDQRPKGWAWLANGVRVDQHLVCAIVDVAHTITMAALPDDPATARAATEKALLAAPYEDTPQLDWAAILRAEGDQAAAQRHLIDHVCNRHDDGEAPEELPPRTEAIVGDPRWTPHQVA